MPHNRIHTSCIEILCTNLAKTMKIGTLEKKQGPNRDTKSRIDRQASSPHHQIGFGFVSDGETSVATPLERM